MKKTTKILRVCDHNEEFVFLISYEGSREQAFNSDCVLFGIAIHHNNSDEGDGMEFVDLAKEFWQDKGYEIELFKGV